MNGNIFLNAVLDREEQEHHHFIVAVSDKGLPTLSSTAHMWITGNNFYLDCSNCNLKVLHAHNL